MNMFDLDGFSFVQFEDGGLMVQLTEAYASDEVIVPDEVNGIPVTSFVFSAKDVSRKINSIKIPSSLRNFSADPFYLEHSIRLEIDENNPHLFTDGKAVYSKKRSELIFFLARGDEEYTIHEDCKTINKQAFALSKNLKRIVFPSGLKTIEDSAFVSCGRLEEIGLPDGLIGIGVCAFKNCPKLEKLTLPSTLEYIGSEAFAEDPEILSVHLPKPLKEIGESAFSDNCEISLSDENPYFICRDGFILSPDGRKLVRWATPPENGILVIPEYITEISPYAFSHNNKIEKVVFPRSLHTIGDSAFWCADNLRELELENVSVIGRHAFSGCNSLERVRLKCGELGERVFAHCGHLTEAEVDCPRTGDYMFAHCPMLRRVVLKHTKVIGIAAFTDLTGLREIVFPPELESIETAAFYGCGIRSLTIPKTVRRIGEYIANEVREIHIYDNIETDIGMNNVLSDKDYILYVRSAETDEIKYAVPIIGGNYHKYHQILVHKSLLSMFKGGASFDFKKFDARFEDAMFQFEGIDTDFLNTPLAYLHDKLNAGLLRLKYGFELDDDVRRKYEARLDKLSCYITKSYINENTIEPILEPALYTYMSIDNLRSLIDISVERHLTELTAFLMRVCNDKREGNGGVDGIIDQGG
ncbi:MAG: leucine-rich repeat protein [Oscillospiraceae bacterium]|nr:leucine-rich repeat protein [Oscillospiraceae bacterium]